ncbi:MAG: DUF624 domain-containing protein [Salana multivorans]|nr:DUF624 domain-containing protein [Salana multivorans]
MDVDGSGAGRMVRAARTINRCVVLGLCLALACAPSVVVGLFVSATPLGLVLYVLGLVAVAPALSAGLYAVRGWRRDPGAGSARLFLRGYRMNVVDVLRWWVPTLVAAAVVYVAGDGAMLLLAWVFVVLLELVARPLVAHVTARLTPAEPDAG